MEDWMLALMGILVILITTWNTQENMTNKDLVSTLQTFGDKGSKKKSDEIPELPVYGPKVQPPVDPAPTKSSDTDKTSGVYPDIYGPDIAGVPGTQHKSKDAGTHYDPKSTSDVSDYNPALLRAFPVSGPPQPYLNDFSKMMK